jgi:drug/metabolite transporter (DMT)-like permease
MTLMMVLIMMIYRRFPETPTTLPTVGASLFLLPISWHFSDPLSAAPDEIALMALFGITFVIASITLAQGSKLVMPGETALLSISESPWAIILAILFLAEWPSMQTVIGGTVILSAVLWYQVMALRRGV